MRAGLSAKSLTPKRHTVTKRLLPAIDALDLADGATFTVQLAGHSRETITGTFSAGRLTHAYEPGDGFGLIDAIDAVQAVKQTK
jgi:hypothetical protein